MIVRTTMVKTGVFQFNQKNRNRRMKMSVIDRLFSRSVTGKGAIGLLLIRLVVGSAFMLHGWGKIQHPFSWMGPESPVPGFFQLLAAISEFGGGLAWILGLLTPLA